MAKLYFVSDIKDEKKRIEMFQRIEINLVLQLI